LGEGGDADPVDDLDLDPELGHRSCCEHISVARLERFSKIIHPG
jgi:hypothetical protein